MTRMKDRSLESLANEFNRLLQAATKARQRGRYEDEESFRNKALEIGRHYIKRCPGNALTKMPERVG